MCGKRGNVCINNKCKTLQTCIYCFEHLKHPCFVEEKTKRSTKGSLIRVTILNVSL
ncbi:uncharacterized protein B0P05DRAFT_544813 [Gilbertella persicaria]|uniref:uncharacterized protein n=1 Tax=Gilbertella persicaria TaxID=101096 RepID=UPI00221F52C3|nr:uncharacterized protein B0P05DRAFT_544813 [Gilbertella persicaria]KAI8077382.1 hypothetical protein B0P05DRAFT_544813 [Gilbertella persicaria]